MIIRFLLIVSIIFTFCTYSSKGQTRDSIRPKVGLVFSGGGAKGLAHIGVLKLLEKHHIPIDYITGTSMGSIVGALYSIGYSADEIENIARSMDWAEIFDGSTERKLISIEEKDLEGKYILEVPMKNGKPVIATGLILGQKLEMELAKITWSVHGVNDFLKFPIPFSCIATNIETGEAVVLNKGYLPDVIRASMAIPSVFSAVLLDGKLLVDGGLVRNFPVSDVRAMGADIVIGIDVASPLYKKDQLNSMLKVMEQAASFLNEQTNIKETKLVDILIKPDITGFDASSFDAADTLIKRGEDAALLVENQIINLKKQLELYSDTVRKIQSPPSLFSIYIHRVQIDGLNKVSKALIKSKLNIKDSSWVTLNDIQQAVSRVYGSKYFEKVNYRIIQSANENTLIIRVIEQPFSIYKIGINYNNYFNASLGINGTFRNILGDGSRLVLFTKLGLSPEFSFDYSIFTNIKPNVGFIIKSEYFNFEEPFNQATDSISISLYNHTFNTRLGFASSISNSTLFLLGTDLSYKLYKPVISGTDVEISKRTAIQVFSELKIDNLDRNIYPQSGAFFNIYAAYMINELQKTVSDFDKKYWKFRLLYEHYFPLGTKFTYSNSFAGAISIADNLFYDDQFFIGGEINFKNYIFPLTGFRFMQIAGQNILTAGMELRYEPWKNKFLFLHVNGGLAQKKLQDIFNFDQIYFGTSLGVGIKTVLGPIEYKISRNNVNNTFNHWIKIGYYF